LLADGNSDEREREREREREEREKRERTEKESVRERERECVLLRAFGAYAPSQMLAALDRVRFFSSLLLSSLEWSDTKVYEP